MKPPKAKNHGRVSLDSATRSGNLSRKLLLVTAALGSLSFATCTSLRNAGLGNKCYWGFSFYLPPAGVYDWSTLENYASGKEPVEIFALSKHFGLVHERFPPGQEVFPSEPFFGQDVAWTVVIHTGRVGDFFLGPFPSCKPGEAEVRFLCQALIQYPLGPVEETACGKQDTGTLFLALSDPESDCPGLEDYKLELAKRDGTLQTLRAAGKRCEDLVLPLAPLQAQGTLFLVVARSDSPAKAIPVKTFGSLDGSKCYRVRFIAGPRPPFVNKVFVRTRPSNL
jgi:hypothetical protein